MFVIGPEDRCNAIRVPPGRLHISSGRLSLALDLPWFVAQVSSEAGGPSRSTVLLAVDSELLALVREPNKGRIKSLLVLAPSKEDGWMVSEIAEVWIASAEEAAETGPLLFRQRGAAEISTCWGEEVRDEQPGRVLVLTLCPRR